MKTNRRGFTLVEMALAIALAGGVLGTFVVLLPIGIENYRENQRVLMASHLLAVAANDLLNATSDQKTTPIFSFDLSENHSSSQAFDLSEDFEKSNSSAPENYHVTLTWLSANPHDYKAQQARIEITWPATMNPLTAKLRGQCEETLVVLNVQ